MQPEQRDAAHLHDAIEAGEAIVRFSAGMDYDEYLSTELKRAAIERQLTVLGEAVKRISAAFRDANPAIPWSKIVGLRNVLMHEYDEIDHRRIFVIATELVPGLLERFRAFMPPIPPDPEPE